MNSERHPITFPMTAIRPGVGRQCHVYLKPKTEPNGDTVAEIMTEREDGVDLQLLTPINRKEAVKLINALRDLFGIASDEKQAVDLIDGQMQRMDALAENLINVSVVNLMYENGIRKASLTPSRIIVGMTPKHRVVATPDQITYVLEEDPLNESPNPIAGSTGR